MRHNNKPSIFNNKLGIFIVIVAIVVIALIVFGSRNPDVQSTENESINESLQQEDQSMEPVNVVVEDKTDLEEVIEKTLSEKGMCEDYTFNEGDSVELNGFDVTVERMSSSSVRVTVDKTTFFLASGKNKLIDEEFLVELRSGNLYYFGPEDPDNTVVLRLGCERADEDSSEKYVRDRGKVICEQVYQECRDSFGLD